MSQFPDIRKGDEITADWLNGRTTEGPLEIRVGPGLLMQRSGRSIIIAIDPAGVPQQQGLRPMAQRMRVQEIFDDYLRCRTFDGPSATTGDDDIYVAKHWLAQHNRLNYATTDGVGQTLETVDEQTATATAASTETWKTTHEHFQGCDILATYVVGGTGVQVDDDELFWMEIGPRQMGKVPEE